MTESPDAVRPAELRSLRAEVRAFLADLGQPGRSDAWMTGHDPDFSAQLGDRGWVGMTIPKAHGGSGRSFLERYVVVEELLAAGAPVAAHWFADRQVAPAILRSGTDHLRQRFLPEIARGRLFFAIGLSEHGAGSDLAAVRTRARKVDGGWRITGSKVWTSWAHKAHAVLALVRTESSGKRHHGLTQMIIPLPASGLTIVPIRSMSGEHHFNELLLDDVFVADELVLGQPGHAWSQVLHELQFERSGPERFLSTFPLLAQLHEESVEYPSRIVARAWCLRQLSREVAIGISETQSVPRLEAAVVKDLGTAFEHDSLDELIGLPRVSLLRGDSASPTSRSAAEALLGSPGYTIRGGASEVIRQLIAREALA
jgi:acyl-CoA dehydrogenase